MIITTNQHHICEDNGIMVIVMMIINIDQHYNCGNNCHYSTQSLPWRTVVINHQELSYFLWIAFRLIDENDAQTFWQKWRWQCWWCNRPATQHHPCSSSTWRHISGNYTLWQLIIDLVCLPLSWLPLKTPFRSLEWPQKQHFLRYRCPTWLSTRWVASKHGISSLLLFRSPPHIFVHIWKIQVVGR